MAYVDRFIFRFNSVSGKAVRIAIADNDYTGTAVERRLGGSLQLRCELSGNIHGMSLEIPAECEVDDEFAVLYTSDPTRFAVRLEVDSVVVWRGFVTPELYAAPWIDPPYDVQITATDGLGELKMLEWPAIGSRTLGEILETTLGATGLALPVRMISTAANDLATAADLLTGTTVNLDHMAGKSYYDVLDGLLGSLHCTILQRGGAWLLVRETDVTSLTSGGQVSDTSGNKYPVKPFGSSSTHDCWPVGRLTTEIVPAKSTVEAECPNHLASLIADPDMELNLWQTNGSWTDEDGGYYTLDLGEYISQTFSVANATRDADPGFRIKVSSRHTTPFDVGIMRLTVMATGRNPRSGSDTTLYLKEVTTQGRTQMEWVTEESHFDDGLGLPKTLDHQDCKEFVTDIFHLPTGFNPIKTITIKVSSGRNTVCVHSVNIECMSVYDRAVTRLLMDNGARGDESYSPLFADSFAGNKGNFLLSNSPKGVTGALVRTWSSDAIPSVPYGEWLSKDMALSVATPRLRMSGRLFTVTSFPALFYSNKGLSYITEEWSLDLIEDEADISLISLPAAALSTVSVSVIVEDKDGRQGTVSGGEIVSPKTGEAVSPSGTLDWFIAEAYEEDGEIKYRLKLNPKYQGMYAEGWVSAGGVSDQGGSGSASYLHELLDVDLPAQIGDGQALIWDANLQKWTSGDVTIDTTPFERVTNKVTSVSAASDNTQYPTAKAVYDIVNTMLSSAMRYQGVTTTALVDGSTTNPVVIDGERYTATKGDVVVRSNVGLEYLWTGTKWQQLGDESSFAKKTVTITGSGYLTGGGNLEAARTLDIAETIKTKIDNGAEAYERLGNYLPLTAGSSKPLTGALYIKIPYSSSQNTYANYFRFTNSGDTEVASMRVSGAGHIGFYANHSVEFFAGNTRRFAVTTTNLNPGTNGTINLTSEGVFSSLGDGYDIGRPVSGSTEARYVRAVYSKMLYLTDSAYIYYDTVNDCIRTNVPIASDSWISAGGVSDTGGGASYLRDLLDVDDNIDSTSNYGKYLYYDATLGKWTAREASGTQGTVTSVALTVPTGLSVSGSPVTSSGTIAISLASGYSIPTTAEQTQWSTAYRWGDHSQAGYAMASALGNYLPLTGGTMTGTIHRSMIKDSSSYQDVANWVNESGDNLAKIGYWNIPQAVFINPNGSTDVWSDEVGKYSLKISPSLSGLTFNTYPVWHAGNDGSGSGLDADLLDGLHAADFKRQISGNKRIYTSGWYRILNCKAYPASFLITFGGFYYDYLPTPVTFLISHSYSATSIIQVGRCPVIGAIKKIRVVHHDTYMFYIDVKFEVGQGKNNPITFTVTPLDNCYGELDLIDFTLQSDGGESAIDTVRSISVADALNIPRTIWGQSFDGTADVTGDLTLAVGANASIGAAYTAANQGKYNFITFGNAAEGLKYTSGTWTSDANAEAHRFYVGSQATLALTIKNSGNVGIGTASPAYKLDVNGDGHFASRLNIGSSFSGNSSRATLSVITSSDDPCDLVLGSSGQNKWSITSRASNENNSLRLYSYVAGNYVLYANHSGNVGIGTASPAYKLDVNGSAKVAGTLTSQAIKPSATSTSQSTGYDLGASNAFWKNTYTRRVYLADGIYVYYDSDNQCIRTNAPIVSDSYISAGGVSTT